VLVTLTLSDPPFTRGGTKPNTALTMAGVPKSADATAGGTAEIARIKEGVRRAVPLLCGLGLIETMRGPQRRPSVSPFATVALGRCRNRSRSPNANGSEPRSLKVVREFKRPHEAG